MSHSRSSANWFVGAISEDQGVAERAASLPGRVCLNDLHIVHGAVLGVCFHHSNSIHHAYTLTHTAKNGMLAIKPLGGSQGHKEPAAVGVRPCIGHCENSSPCEFQVWIKFIFKLLAIDRRTTSTCPCWVTSLDHKVFDDSVEFGAIVVTSMSQFSEVLQVFGASFQYSSSTMIPMLVSRYTLGGCQESGGIAAMARLAENLLSSI